MVSHLANGVHSVLVLGPFIEFTQLPSRLSDVIIDRIKSGNLKLVSTESQDPSIRRFSVAGRERIALRLLQNASLKVQSELRSGHIDGSFWSTAESLQTLEELPDVKARYDKLVQKSLALANEHDRNGSYDEVFGVTCALLWMRGKYLGVTSPEAKATIDWVRSRVGKYEQREQALAYLTFSDLGILEDSERDALAALLTNLDTNLLSEIDLVVYLRAALAADHSSVVPSLIAAIGRKQTGGAWLDLATTANAVTTLVDALDYLHGGGSGHAELAREIEKMVFGGVIHIQDALESSFASGENNGYPWDGKASTTVKCIQAWLKFEDLIDLPVHEIVDALGGYDRDSTALWAGRQALSVLEDVKDENAELRESIVRTMDDVKTVAAERDVANRRARNIVVVAIPLVISIYLLATLIAAVALQGGVPLIISITKKAFVDGWPFHLAFLAVLAGYLGLPWRKWLGGNK